ncbi:MAG: HDIG domain-containing protein [Paludibacteraceae bacterium]|nr:HDIG domain-containing protein [Paludibacteraceae bacterium]
MKGKIVALNIRYVVYTVSLMLAVVAIYFLLPKEDNFDRYFEIGKPWAYETVMAPKDFAIYKSDDQLEKERAEALTRLEPYVAQSMDHRLQITGIKDLRMSDWLLERLNEVYEVGVISLQDKQEFEHLGVKKVIVLEGNSVKGKVLLNSIFTPKTAYDYIISKASVEVWIDDNLLKTSDIVEYIEPNLLVDKVKTDQALQIIVDGVMLTSGMVQKGEKIIDKGEVVVEESYQILKSLQRAVDGDELSQGEDVWKIIGNVVLILVLIILFFAYFVLFRPKVLESIRATEFMILMMLGILGLLALVTQYLELNEYLVPFAMLALVVRVFFDSRTALYVHIITVLLAGQMVPDATEFVFLQILVGMVAVSSLKDMNSRAQLVKSALFIFVVYGVSFVAMELARGVEVERVDWSMLFVFALNSVALLFAYGLIFIIEKLFGFLSEVTLVELSNINSPLLMEFSEKCPGTFQHVLQVSNLAVEVAKKIRANALLVRTGALYHDLGKMVNPLYYTENQTGVNPLNELSYEEAAQVIISHVQEGVKIAEKHNLPYQIIEFISMHHGCSKVKYFYNSFKNQYPDKEVDERKFTYPGPLPSTKETAILMMSDAVEAASRSLKSYDEESISRLVEGVVNGQMADGQFRNSPISFRDVEVAKRVFVEKLQNIYHTRIQYPELKVKKDEKSALDEINKTLRKVRTPYRFQKK